ncbi:MAG: c-type cytochrome biogenesis protein CcsB [Halothiobacillaceae bacterium]|nr:MAG: c-type cytochrome biogenesis protein CcsB [Halothiobacillaceae bacterium]
MSATSDALHQSPGRAASGRSIKPLDILWLVAVLVAGFGALAAFGDRMDGYEVGILVGSTLGLAVFGGYWRSVRGLTLAVAAMTAIALWRYGAHFGDQLSVGLEALTAVQGKDFFLKFLFASQSAIMWMSALYVGATFTYFLALFTRTDYIARIASVLVWSATAFGLTGLLARWRESYLINVDYGHIPVSNLYEVFILFSVITALIYMYYEGRYRTRNLGGFVMLVISAAVGFLLWYTFDRGANAIQPLVPALNSYWMKIHVPANFIGYGAFGIAAMVGIAYLIKHKLGGDGENDRLPRLEVLDDLMYKAIALGFGFFTVATILGAMWAAEAWGGYWSWDPKETWALIVWLNYAAWLHMRLTKGWRGTPMAWWSVVGLFVTTFAFLGVNMFLSGLHSYGTL